MPHERFRTCECRLRRSEGTPDGTAAGLRQRARLPALVSDMPASVWFRPPQVCCAVLLKLFSEWLRPLQVIVGGQPAPKGAGQGRRPQGDSASGERHHRRCARAPRSVKQVAAQLQELIDVA